LSVRSLTSAIRTRWQLLRSCTASIIRRQKSTLVIFSAVYCEKWGRSITGRTLNERTRTFFTRLRIRTDTETAAGRIIVVSNWRVYIIINTRFVETADPISPPIAQNGGVRYARYYISGRRYGIKALESSRFYVLRYTARNKAGAPITKCGHEEYPSNVVVRSLQ